MTVGVQGLGSGRFDYHVSGEVCNFLLLFPSSNHFPSPFLPLALAPSFPPSLPPSLCACARACVYRSWFLDQPLHRHRNLRSVPGREEEEAGGDGRGGGGGRRSTTIFQRDCFWKLQALKSATFPRINSSSSSSPSSSSCIDTSCLFLFAPLSLGGADALVPDA